MNLFRFCSYFNYINTIFKNVDKSHLWFGIILALVPGEEPEILPVEAGGGVGVAHVLLRLAPLHPPRQLLQRSELGLVLVFLPISVLVALALGALRVGFGLRVLGLGELTGYVHLWAIII